MKGLFTKTNFRLFLFILATVVFQACTSTGAPMGTIIAADGTVISARGAVGGLETAPSGPLYTGDGGKNIRLAILAPQVQGEAPGYLPLYIQGLLNNNFSKYSAINLIDRQNLDKIIAEQNLAANGRFSDSDFIRIGNLTNAQYFLFGTIQKLSGDRYSLQLSITDSSTGVRRANFMKNGSLSQLEGRGTLINEATAELLSQLGVELTETGLKTLLAGNTSTARAEAGLARGITAQAGGSEIEALFNYTQVITFDPSQIEALSRLNILSSTISGGTISQRILNDIQARDSWLNVFKETARFFNDHPPFEIIFDPNLIQIGQTDYKRRTANIGMKITLYPSEAGFGALNALLEGLEKTGRRGVWGFSGWPLMDTTPRTAGTVVFGGRRTLSYKVDVALINEKNKTLGNSSVTLTTKRIRFSAGDTRITPPNSVEGVVNFRNIKEEDLTETLTIVIVAVNGISSQNINASGYMKIETGNLERKAAERQTQQWEVAERQRQQARQVPSTNQGIASASPGDYIIRSSGEKVILSQADINYARNQLSSNLTNRSTSNNDRERELAEQQQHGTQNLGSDSAYYDRGIEYFRRLDYDRAIADFTQAIRLNPNNAIAYYNRGNVYNIDKRDYDRAIADYTQVIRLDPNNARAYNNRGNAYYNKRDINRAIADFEAALRIEPNNAAYRQNLENARQARGR